MRFRSVLLLAAAPIALGQARAQGSDALNAAGAAVTFVLRDLPKGPLVIDAAALRADPALADSIAGRFKARRDSAASLMRCTEGRQHRRQWCTIQGGAVLLAIGTPTLSAGTATIDLTWRVQEAPGVIDYQWRKLELTRTETGSWTVTKELVRGRQ